MASDQNRSFLFPHLNRDDVREGIAANEELSQTLLNLEMTAAFRIFLRDTRRYERRAERRKQSFQHGKIGIEWGEDSPMSEGLRKLQSLQNEEEE